MAANSVRHVSRDARDDSLAHLRQGVSGRFRSLGASAGALRAEVRSAADWRGQLRRHPFWLVGIVAGAALLAARLVPLARRGPLPQGLVGLVAGTAVRHLGRKLGRRLDRELQSRRTP